MSEKNKVQLIGHLGSNPEIKTFDGNKKRARISIATKDTYVNARGERMEDNQWHNVIAWGKTAETAEKLFSKGMEVMIDGRLVNRSYVDKDGNKKYITEVVANDLRIVSTTEKEVVA